MKHHAPFLYLLRVMASLPGKGKAKDLAKDVAAMANDGGVLLYGVGEDEKGRPTTLTPIELAGARERVDQIIRTSISEPPDVQVREVQKEEEPSLGYLVVIVPSSPRAPHMVVVGKDHRFYGRTDTGNAPLTEGEVARLYERRQRWEVNRGALLDEVIGSAPIEPQEDFAYLHLFARPVVPDEDLLDRAREEQQAGRFLSNLVVGATDSVTFARSYSPDLSGNYNFEPRADGWETRQGLDEYGNPYHDPGMVLSMHVNLDGGGHLFCGGVAELHNNHLVISELVPAGLTTKFLAVMGRLYAAGAYLGPVDVGLAVIGLRGGISNVLRSRPGVRPHTFDKDEYRRTDRFLASTLENAPRSAARSLVFPLIRATTRDSYDPFVD